MSTSDLGMPPILDPGEATEAERAVLLAAPRGYCAGVDRAVITVEKALDLYDAPVYVRKQIVHNKHVVRDLEARGAVFVEEIAEVPEGATVVFSAHGVSPAVRDDASGIFLVIVGGKPVVLCGYERLEKEPRLSRTSAQLVPVPCRERRAPVVG